MKHYLTLTVLTVTAGSLLDPPGAHYHADLLGNYEPLLAQTGEGPGEGGAPVRLEGGARPSLEQYGMAMEVSDLIALNRSIPDLRTPGCR